MPSVNVFAKFKLRDSSGVVFTNTESYPLNPDLGQLAFVNKILAIYTEISPGVLSWVPLITEELPVYKHIQGVNSTTWNIAHNLTTDDLIFYIYDSDDNLIDPASYTFVDQDNMTLTFNEMIKGKCIVFSYDARFIGSGGEPAAPGYEAGIALQFQELNILSIDYNFESSESTINTINYATGNKQTFDYNGNGDVAKSSYFDTDGSTLLADQVFNYDALNRVSTVNWVIY